MARIAAIPVVSGNWTLRIVDAAGGDVGTLENWRLLVTFSDGSQRSFDSIAGALPIPDAEGGADGELRTRLTVDASAQDRWLLKDKGSTNGTYVGSAASGRVSEQRLHDDALAVAGTGEVHRLGRDGDAIVILLTGGTKKQQQRDIEAAHAYWQDYKRSKRG